MKQTGKLMVRSDPYALPLDTSNDSLGLIGGKGKSLARMTNAGFSVPTGFHLTTEAYKCFVDRNELQSKILTLAQPEIRGLALSFEQASNNIRNLFDQAEMPDDVVAEAFARSALAPSTLANPWRCRTDAMRMAGMTRITMAS